MWGVWRLCSRCWGFGLRGKCSLVEVFGNVVVAGVVVAVGIDSGLVAGIVDMVDVAAAVGIAGTADTVVAAELRTVLAVVGIGQPPP